MTDTETERLNDLAGEIRDAAENRNEAESIIEAKLAESLALFPMQGVSATACRQHQHVAWLRWIEDEGLTYHDLDRGLLDIK